MATWKYEGDVSLVPAEVGARYEGVLIAWDDRVEWLGQRLAEAFAVPLDTYRRRIPGRVRITVEQLDD